MNNFWALVGFELRKVIHKKSSYLSTLLFLFIIIVSVLMNSNGNSAYHSALGGENSNFENIILDRDVVNSSSGIITEEKIHETIIIATNGLENPDNYWQNPYGESILKPEAKIEFALPNYNTYNLINAIYKQNFDERTIPISQISPDLAFGFYDTYKSILHSNIETDSLLSAAQKAVQIDMVNDIKTPFYSEYADGFLKIATLLILAGNLVLMNIAFIVGNIFSYEYDRKTSFVILTTKNGKSTVIWAKITTCVIVSITISVILFGAYSLLYLLIYGFCGFNVPIQFLTGFEFSVYPILLWEFLAIIWLVVIVVAVSFSVYCAMISSITKTSASSISVIYMTLILPLFFPSSSNVALNQVTSLIFPRTMSVNTIFNSYFFEIFDIVLKPYNFYIFYYLFLAFIFAFITKIGFKNHQVC